MCQEPGLEEFNHQVLLVCHGRKTLRQAAQVGGRKMYRVEKPEVALFLLFCSLHHMLLVHSCFSGGCEEASMRDDSPHPGTHLLSLHFSAVRWKSVDYCVPTSHLLEETSEDLLSIPSGFSSGLSPTCPWQHLAP